MTQILPGGPCVQPGGRLRRERNVVEAGWFGHPNEEVWMHIPQDEKRMMNTDGTAWAEAHIIRRETHLGMYGMNPEIRYEVMAYVLKLEDYFHRDPDDFRNDRYYRQIRREHFSCPADQILPRYNRRALILPEDQDYDGYKIRIRLGWEPKTGDRIWVPRTPLYGPGAMGGYQLAAFQHAIKKDGDLAWVIHGSRKQGGRTEDWAIRPRECRPYLLELPDGD